MSLLDWDEIRSHYRIKDREFPMLSPDMPTFIRIAHEVGRRGPAGFSFICIPPGSAVVYRTIVYVIVYLLAGMALVPQPACGAA